ncbi:MAG: cyclic pyranopterin monophosphate synthase MoaC [Myxococcales bacterium]|nr:cyclic pyranopterin monophosphate synthase MoaC [Myxococcales bacterium]
MADSNDTRGEHGRELSHLDAEGRLAMVDISDKKHTLRTARARGRVAMAPATRALITAGELPKGNVLTCAQLAGIQAAKRTAELIPLCHPLRLTFVGVEFELEEDGVVIHATARAADATGVEMEALTAVSVAALCIYDMCKAVDREMRIEAVRLVEKSGGRSGHYRADEAHEERP